MTPGRGIVGLGAALVLAGTAACLAACGDGAEADRPERRERVLPSLEPQFGERRMLWAQGGTIHYGADKLRACAGAVRALHSSRYGFVVGMDTPPSEVGTWAVVDKTGTHRIPGEVRSVAVSREGSYLGWIDWAGPWRPAGQVAQAVVADMSTGEVVSRTSEGMGGESGDDLGVLYSEHAPVFLGFRGRHAYYKGSGDTYQWDLATGEKSLVQRQEAAETYRRPPWRTGLDYMQPNGFITADERYLVDSNTAGRVTVWARSGGRPQRIDLDYGHRFVFFGHMLGADRAVLLTLDHYLGDYDPTVRDRTRGHLTVCDFVTATCRDKGQVRGTWSVVFPAGSATSWGEF